MSKGYSCKCGHYWETHHADSTRSCAGCQCPAFRDLASTEAERALGSNEGDLALYKLAVRLGFDPGTGERVTEDDVYRHVEWLIERAIAESKP